MNRASDLKDEDNATEIGGIDKIESLFMAEQIKDGAMHNYIRTITHELGIDEFLLTDSQNDSSQANLVSIDIAAKIIVDYSVGALRYIHGKNNEIDSNEDAKKDTSLMLFFILESILFAHAKSHESSKMKLDCLGKIDANYLLMESFMTGTLAPRVGGVFDPDTLKDTKKVVQEISSIQAAKALRLTGLSLISELNLQNFDPRQRALFISGRTIEEITGIVAGDIQQFTSDTIKLWSINRSDELLLRSQIESSITRIYESSLNSEFKAMQKELTDLDAAGKRDYLAMIKTMPNGNLIERTRKAVKNIIAEAAAQDAQQAHSTSVDEDSLS